MIEIAISVVLLVAGLAIGYFVCAKMYAVRLKASGKDAANIIENAKKQVEADKKEALLDTKEEIQRMKEKADLEIRDKKSELSSLENRIINREENVDRRLLNLENRERTLENKDADVKRKEEKLKERESKAEKLIAEQHDKLLEISRLTREEAQETILKNLESEMTHEIAKYIKDAEEMARSEAKKKAKEILVSAIQRYAADQSSDHSVYLVNLPSDEMKGRIIGREGRNIRTLESLTGVDFIVDDTPESVVLSCFDPIRREVARMTLETLIHDGRIHPARIEEVVEKSRNEIDSKIIEVGENAIFDLGIGRIHKDLLRLLGRLHYRTSYGQNVLQHSMEVAYISGLIAAEVGEDVKLARRSGLLHDIGKSADHDLEGSHVEIGVTLANKFREPEVVVDAIASHHGDTEAKSLIAVIVATADSLSAARPGARRESIENYIKRLEKLENIASSFKGVERAFAIQAGREVRVAVVPSVLDDAKTRILTREIRRAIESDLSYPGSIKITVVRETRFVETAK